MEKVDPCKVIEALLNVREIVQTATAEARRNISFKDDECNDLTHLLEFGDFNAVQTCKIAKELQDAKRIRRECKNANELLAPLFEYLNKHNSFFNGLEQIRIDIEKNKRVQKRRKYEIRVREDLRETMQKVQTN